MADKMTREDKLAQIEEARACYKEAARLIAKGNALVSKGMRGSVALCSHPNSLRPVDYVPAYKGMIEIHLFSGIEKLAKMLEVNTEPEVDWEGKKYKDRKVLCVNGIKFFQIGDAKESKYSYR